MSLTTSSHAISASYRLFKGLAGRFALLSALTLSACMMPFVPAAPQAVAPGAGPGASMGGSGATLVPFDPVDAPAGHGWYCAVVGDSASFCERDLRDCARKQRDTPEAAACIQWNKPGYCHTVTSTLPGSSGKIVECFMDEAWCTDRRNTWFGPSASGVGDVSECGAVR